jgi:hypothetical protein
MFGRSSTEAIELCTQGKDWIIQEYSTASFSFLDMMQSGYNNNFLKLEMEKIHTTIKKRSISQGILVTGPIVISPGFEKEVVWNLWWQELSLKDTSKSIHNSPADQELALIRNRRFVVSGPFLFAIITGILSTTTSAVTAHVISTNEAHKVMDAEVVHREEDNSNSIV